MNSTHTINDNLLKIENLITALNFLHEEIQTRNNEFLKGINNDLIVEKLKDLINNDYNFRYRFIRFIRDEYGSNNLVKDVAFAVMEKIDEDIEAFVNARVDARLKELGVNVN